METPGDVGEPRQHVGRSARVGKLVVTTDRHPQVTASDDNLFGTVDATVAAREHVAGPSGNSGPSRVSVRNPPAFATAELFDAVQQAREAGSALREAPVRDARALARQYYAALVRMSLRFLFPADGRDSSPRASALEVLQGIHRDEPLFTLIGTSASGWLGWSGRDTPGIVLAGRVLAEDRQQAVPLLELQLAGKYPRKVQLIVAQHLMTSDQRLPRPGTDVLACGMLIENAEVELVGYPASKSPLPLVWGVPVLPAADQ
jgi:hypothetical protein